MVGLWEINIACNNNNYSPLSPLSPLNNNNYSPKSPLNKVFST